MEYLEWDHDQFDEWEMPTFMPYTGDAPIIDTTKNTEPKQIKGTVLPEVEILSSSDEDAPKPPPTTQLARENNQLRALMTDLKRQSQKAELVNSTLKNQLTNFRDSFKNQMKSSVFTMFK